MKKLVLSFLFYLGSSQLSFAEFEGEYYTKIERNAFTKKFEENGYVRITSLYDSVVIKSIQVNRGNCFSTDKIKEEIKRIENNKEKDFFSGVFVMDYKLLLSNLIKEIKFGENIELPLAKNCTIKELIIESNMGIDKLEW